MAVELEGGCRVAQLKEGKPLPDGDLLVWNHFEGALSLRVLELHGSTTFQDDSHDEVLYVLEGSPLPPDTGIYIPAGQAMQLSGDMTLVSSRAPAAQSHGHAFSVHLDDQPVQKTGDRWYRELIQGETTQFVGSIPPGRAPDHFHLYEEVMCILQGSGRMWAGSSSTPIAPGSCIFLPRKQVHCVENLTSGELRLLGMFYPAGSPAVRYPP
jgi:mannose-6-phosphate isomerase-like protein (cupin superfamily)